MLALWNACPVKCEAYLTGAKPIPLGPHALCAMRHACPVESKEYSTGAPCF